MAKEPWEIWEDDVNNSLNLRGTISSGSKFYDIGDGVGTDFDSQFRLMVDAKCTKSSSYSLKHKLLDDWLLKSREKGTVFALPVRFNNGKGNNTDFVVLSFDDFVEIIEYAKAGEGKVFTDEEKKLINKLIEHSPPKIKTQLENILDKMK